MKKSSDTKTAPEKTVKRQLPGIHKIDTFLTYVEYIASPRALRPQIFKTDGDTDAAFIKKYKSSKISMAAWKKRTDFWEMVKDARKKFFRARTADAILSLEQTAIKEGRGADVKVLLTYTDEYEERNIQEHTLHPKLEAALDKLDKIIP